MGWSWIETARGALGALRAEAVLGWRLAARHPGVRAVVGASVGLAALIRVLNGPAPEVLGSVVVGLAGLLGAAAGPRAFARAGPFESLRWIGLAPAAAIAGRLAGAVAFSCLGAGIAAALVAGPSAPGPAALAAAAVHATIVGAMAAALTPVLGGTGGTLLPLLLVVVGAGAPYATVVLETGAPVGPVPPPGMLAVGLLEGGPGVGVVGSLVAWLAVAALGMAGVARTVGTRGCRHTEPAGDAPAVVCQGVTCADAGGRRSRGALDEVTLAVESGEIVAVVGAPPDGPGALLRVVAGLQQPQGGQVAVRWGRPRGARGFGYVHGGFCGPAELTPVEWLRYVAHHHRGRGRARAMRVQAALALVGLADLAGRRIGLLDRDAVEQLAVATCAVSGAAVLLLDGCFAGVHAATRQGLTDALADLAAQGKTVLLAPREVRAVETVATRVVVLRDGRVLADLRMTALQQERVAELRLNGGALPAVSRITAHFPDAVRTGTGVDVPLRGGRTLEAVLALCRSERIPILGSRVRYRAVDDLLAAGWSTPDPERVAVLG